MPAQIERCVVFETSVKNWPKSGWQIDADFPMHAGDLFHRSRMHSDGSIEHVSRETDLGDSIMTAIVMAPFIENLTAYADLGRLRLQECERVVALRTELTKCGANVVEKGDALFVTPTLLHGAEIETYNDHRMAMCFAVVGLRVPGIKLQNPSCVKKTFPNFFQKLAKDLGVAILDAQGKKLGHEDLFAA
jgi:3-phosphoshikimate 1-carboxyvinyltransferase